MKKFIGILFLLVLVSFIYAVAKLLVAFVQKDENSLQQAKLLFAFSFATIV